MSSSGPVVSAGRAPALQAGGHGFDPHPVHHKPLPFDPSGSGSWHAIKVFIYCIGTHSGLCPELDAGVVHGQHIPTRGVYPQRSLP